MESEVLENHRRYLDRVRFYKSFGYDLERERDFILDKSLPFSGEILEIGTGKGHFALSLAKRGYNFTSVDLSKEEQDIALLNLRYYGLDKLVSLIIGDARRLSFPDKSFDTIFCINVFHHLKNQLAVMNEIIRLLKNKGKVVLSDFNAKGLEIINKCHNFEGRKHDFVEHNLEEAKDYFIKKQFDVTDFESDVQRVIIAKNI